MLTRRGLDVVLGGLAEMGFDARWGVLGAHHVGAPHKRDRIWILANAHGVGWEALHVAMANAERERQSSARDGKRGSPAGGVGEANQPGDGGEVPAFVANANGGRCGQCDAEEREFPEFDADGKSDAFVADSAGVGCEAGNELESVCEQSARGDVDRCGAVGPASAADTDGAGCEVQRVRVPKKTEHAPTECGGWWSVEPELGRVAHGVAARVDRLRCIGNGQVPGVVELAMGLLGRDVD